MKYKAFALLTVLALLAALVGVTTPVKAAAYGTNFTTSITYQNVGSGSANVTLDFYNAESGTAIPITLPALPANAGASLFVGSVTQVTSGFKGSAVMSSDQPLVATLVQLAPSGSSVKVRPLSNSFSSGAASVQVPTVLKNFFNSTSIVSIQNVDTVGADLTVQFVPVSGGPISAPAVVNLPSGAAKYYDLGTLGILGSSFNGSMIIKAVKTGTATAGSIVATSLELSVNSNAAYAFEGASQFANTIYMPSALCNFSAGKQNSAYAVQNTGTTPINVTVTYSSGNSETVNGLGGGAKVSFNGCAPAGTPAANPAGFLGSAVITATGPITAVGKVFGGGLSTAFLGFASGSSKVALPYVRWSETQWLSGARQRANIAIQNVGPAPLNAGDVTVKYYDKDGNQVGSTHSLGALAVGAKANSSPLSAGAAGNEFGYIGTSIGGGAIVQGPSGSQLAVIVRIQTYNAGTIVGEDYSGFSIAVP